MTEDTNTPDEIMWQKDAENLAQQAKQLLLEKSWELRFSFPPMFWSKSVLVTGSLDALTQFARNEASRLWVKILDERTGNKCTIAMFCVTVLPMLQQAYNETLN